MFVVNFIYGLTKRVIAIFFIESFWIQILSSFRIRDEYGYKDAL